MKVMSTILDTRNAPLPVQVPIPLEGWGEPETDEQGQTVYRPAKGSYTFEIAVRELRYGYPVDEYWAKWPYRLLVPAVAADGEAGHAVTLSMPSDDSYELALSYRLEDTSGRAAGELKATALKPDLSTLATTSPPRTVGERHGPLPVATFGADQLAAGDYRVILTGADTHAQHPPEPGQYGGWYRDGQNKRMLAVNQVVGRPVAAVLNYRRDSWSQSMLGPYLSQRLYEGLVEVTDEDGNTSMKYRTWPGYASKRYQGTPWETAISDVEGYRLLDAEFLLINSHALPGAIAVETETESWTMPRYAKLLGARAGRALNNRDVTYSIADDYAGRFVKARVVGYVGCESGATDARAGVGLGSLLEATVAQGGARCAFGFTEIIYNGRQATHESSRAVDRWGSAFGLALTKGRFLNGRDGVFTFEAESVLHALDAAYRHLYATQDGLDPYTIESFMHYRVVQGIPNVPGATVSYDWRNLPPPGQWLARPPDQVHLLRDEDTPSYVEP